MASPIRPRRPPSPAEERLMAIERRLDALDGGGVASGTPGPDTATTDDRGRGPGATTAAPADAGDQRLSTELDPETFWALQGLEARVDDDGAVLFTGTVRLASGERYAWQQGTSTNQLLDLEWTERADALAALAHPVRLRLLQLVLLGVRTTAELSDVAVVNTSGQLHHHLKELVHAGWLESPRRGAYVIPAGRVVPLLTIVQAAGGLA